VEGGAGHTYSLLSRCASIFNISPTGTSFLPRPVCEAKANTFTRADLSRL